MRSLALGLVRLSLGFWHGTRDPEFQAIIFLLTISVLGGSIFYHSVEGWSWLDPRGSVKIPRVWSLETPPLDNRGQRR